ncbi:hypothetical protein GQR86_05925 [Providencia vermicola]|nr:hypothetical protein [Providencia sp. G1(2023)]MBC8652916.1 hypothetical protein [Providencia vermicola]
MREVKPTQKPVPSSDIKDLFFNSGLLDIWATSLEHKYIDRFGNCHLTAAGMEWIFNELVTKFKIESEQALLAAGYAPAGTFQEGAEVVSRNGTVLWKLPDGDGDHYRWDGDLPKQVPAGSTPQSTGGIDKGAWVSVGDASARAYVDEFKGTLTDADIYRILALTKKTRMAQKSLMSKIKATITPTGMYARSNNGDLLVGVCMGDGFYPSAIEYRFTPDKDGLLLLRGIRSGIVSSTSASRNAKPPLYVDPSVITAAAPNAYTTKIGATITGKIKSNRFIFKSYQDNRGGSWLVTLTTKETKVEKIISTWRKESASAVEIDVFGEIPYAEYEYTLKFIGQDPHNPPSDGTARGWLYYDPSGSARLPVVNCRLNPLNHDTAKWLSPTNTIVDFAVAARPDGHNGSSTWVPSHGDVTGVSVNINRKVYINGIMLSNAIGTVPDLDMTEIKSFRVDQQFDAKNANAASILWHQWIMHDISYDGELSITNKLEFLSDTWISNAYLGMCAGHTENLTRLVYDTGLEISPLKKDGSTDYYDYGAQSVCLAGYYDQNKGLSHGVVCEVNPQEACNWLSDIQPAATVRQEWRADGVTKTYWTALNNVTVPAGAVIRSQTRYYCVTGVRSPNNELKVI